MASSGEPYQAWRRAGAAWAKCLNGAWLLDTARSLLRGFELPSDKACEASCATLLSCMLEGAPAGVRLSHPWRDFFGELKAPDHVAQRIPSNAERYAGNYQNIIFAGALLAVFCNRPFLVLAFCCGQAVAVLAPPECFDLDFRMPRRGAEFVPIGGDRLRLGIALLSHSGLWVLLFLCRATVQGSLLGVIASLVHAFLRTRPWTEMAKEKLGLKKSS
ncbi:unnamed protein product [Polarella glacialis]|uniref:PRA1 family protein n=1 Tax=Polarella glacialis TaxID=89957 RepID=A0A813FCB9_POLGL|nr:unnamed protein product [Polarella glacialis]CAE8668797.1 unnamed protein product [Polarella glacialis]